MASWWCVERFVIIILIIEKINSLLADLGPRVSFAACEVEAGLPAIGQYAILEHLVYVGRTG